MSDPREAPASTSGTSSSRPSPPESLTQSCGWLMNRIVRYRANLLETELSRLGIKPRHYVTLVALAESPTELTQIELSASLRIDQSTMVLIVDSLEAAGFVSRRRDERDRRRNAIVIAPSGRSLLKEAEKVLDDVQADVFRDVTKDDEGTFRRILQTIAKTHGII